MWLEAPLRWHSRTAALGAAEQSLGCLGPVVPPRSLSEPLPDAPIPTAFKQSAYFTDLLRAGALDLAKFLGIKVP